MAKRTKANATEILVQQNEVIILPENCNRHLVRWNDGAEYKKH